MSEAATFDLWVQHADLSCPLETKITRVDEVMKVYREQDWGAQLALYKELEATVGEYCPAGLGVVRSDGAIFHVCPQENDRINVYWHSVFRTKFLKIFSKRIPMFDASDLDPGVLIPALKSFFSGDDQKVAKLLKVKLP